MTTYIDAHKARLGVEPWRPDSDCRKPPGFPGREPLTRIVHRYDPFRDFAIGPSFFLKKLEVNYRLLTVKDELPWPP